jgi:hypothetical protein
MGGLGEVVFGLCREIELRTAGRTSSIVTTGRPPRRWQRPWTAAATKYPGPRLRSRSRSHGAGQLDVPRAGARPSPAETSCCRYSGEGIWTDYGRELSRRTSDILTNDL